MSHSSAVAYQKLLIPGAKVPLRSTTTRQPLKRSPAKKRPSPPLPKSSKQKIPVSSLEMAKQFANQGKLKEATQSCQTYLQRNPVYAEGDVLLGDISQAQDNPEEAQRCFQKALYLRPNYRKALVHLALLRESKGYKQGAAILKNRIQRLNNLQG